MSDLAISYVTASSASDFNTKVGTGSYDLAILFIQNYSSNGNPALYPDFHTYVAGGGKSLLADWTRNATLGSWFGVTYTGSLNEDDVVLDAPWLQTGIGTTMSLSNPGWGIFSMGMGTPGSTVGAHFVPSNGAAVGY